MTRPTQPIVLRIPDRPTRTKIAAFAGCDERSVHRYLIGRTRPYPATRNAIHAAMRTLGMVPPVEAHP